MPDVVLPFPDRVPKVSPAPPHIALPTLKAFLYALRDAGVPPRLDLTHFGAAYRSQALAALQFLRLADGAHRPTPALVNLVSSLDTDRWPTELGAILRQAYPDVFDGATELTNQEQFIRRFDSCYDGASDALRKARTFFLHAARESDADLHPGLFNGIKPRLTGSKRLWPATPDVRPGGPLRDMSTIGQTAAASRHLRKASSVLLELVEPTKMTREEYDALWLVLKYCDRNNL